jgi:serine/threonine-protein kinase
MASLVGQTLGPYQIVAQLGHGGMATVYKAYHARLDRTVALKMVHPMFLEDQTFVARFEREAQIVARLDHPHIVPVYDFNESHGQPYLVMKFIEGKTLKAFAGERRLSWDEIAQLMQPIAGALDYAHTQGVLHRDIKPSNILIDGAGVPYLSDFGLARMAKTGESTLSHDILLGTPNYISPEQGQGGATLTPRADHYSLGVVLYELVVGRVPFSADTPFAVVHSHIYTPPPIPSSVNPNVPPVLDAMLMRALSKNPAERYESASAMIAAFHEAIQAAPAAFPPPDSVREASRVAMQRAAGYTPASVTDDPPTIQTPPPVAASSADSPNDGTPAGSKRVVEVSFDFGNVGQAVQRTGEQIRTAIERASQNQHAPPPAIPNPNADKAKRSVVQINTNDSSAPIDVTLREAGAAVIDALETAFSANDVDLAAEDDQSAARKRIEKQVKERGEFFSHIGVYIVVNIILYSVYFAASDGAIPFLSDTPIADWSFPWPLVVTLGWGAGLLAHGVETFYNTGARAARRLRLIRDGYRREFGPDWSRTASKSELKRVRKEVEKPLKARQEFFEHLPVYIMINIMLWTIFIFGNEDLLNLINSDDADFVSMMGLPWPLLVTLFWGMGLVAHWFEAWGAGRNERAIQREMERERTILEGEKAKRRARGRRELPGADDSFGDFDIVEEPRAGVRLTGDGELTESMIMELEDEDERRRRIRR